MIFRYMHRHKPKWLRAGVKFPAAVVCHTQAEARRAFGFRALYTSTAFLADTRYHGRLGSSEQPSLIPQSQALSLKSPMHMPAREAAVDTDGQKVRML